MPLSKTNEKLSISELLLATARIYRKNFLLLIGFSLLLFLLSLASIIMPLIKEFIGIPALAIAYTFIQFVLAFPVTFFRFKVSVAMALVMSKKYKNEPVGFMEALALARWRTWKFIWVGFMLCLILAVLSALSVLSFLYAKVIILKYTLIAVLLISIVYLASIYGFGPMMAILEKEKLKYFKVSKKLVKGNISSVILVNILAGFIFMVPYIYFAFFRNNYFEMNIYQKSVLSLLNSILQIFTIPFSSAANVLLYYKLKEKKGL